MARSVDETIYSLFVRIRELLGLRSDDIVIAGGYATYLMGFTSTYTDVDIFYNECRADSLLKLNSIGARFNSSDLSSNNNGRKMATLGGIVFDFVPVSKFSHQAVLAQFDRAICRNLIWWSLGGAAHTMSWVYKSQLFDHQPNITMPSYRRMCNTRHTIRAEREIKYQQRYLVPRLSTMAWLTCRQNAIYPHCTLLNDHLQ